MAKKIFTDESLATFVDEVKSYTDNAVSGKANSSHNHSASNITSGTLSSDRLPTVPIAKGGTGATTAAAALTNLGITATATELNYMDGVTSNIQTQLDGKSGTGHTHNYAGSSSAGGSANSAVKLTTSAGSATKPVYFSDGKPVSCTYELNKTVPSNAVFTDTKYTHPTSSGNKHIPSGGKSEQILKWSADGTAVWGNTCNVVESLPSTSVNGALYIVK